MNLGLLDSPKPYKDARGCIRIDGRNLRVIDLDTGAPVENVKGMLWGPGKTLMDQHPEEGLFSSEHFDRERDYLVIVVECESALSVGRERKGEGDDENT